jgi:transposase
MARPLSLDLRLRVAAALTEGATVREAAARFEVSVASAVRIGQLARAGQGLEAKKFGGPRPLMLLSATEAITARLAAKADWTMRALAADLRGAGIAVSHDTVWRFLRRQGLSFKKNSAGQRDGTSGLGAPANTLAAASAPV